MSWFFPFSDSWKKRACRYLLQRYLGQFLEEKLNLDQLSVDLYNGTGSVSDVGLDIQGLNDLAEDQNLPIEFVDGYISEISVSIPWATILKDSSYVQISGMVLTIQPKQREEEMGAGSLFESMISMTTSMQMAAEIQQTEPPDPGEAETNNTGQAIEGIELIAKTLDSILRKIKVKLVDTTIRLEHLPKESKSGVAIEVHVKNMDYCDEAGCDVNRHDPSLPSGESAFVNRKFHLDGVFLYTDEFHSSARTVSRPLINSTSNSSNTSMEFNEEQMPTSSSIKDTSHDKKSFDPVLFGKLVGRQELSVKVKQSEVIPGPKVDVELNMGSLMIFSTPRQIHLLQELLHGLATPGIQDSSNVVVKEKRMDKADFEKVGIDLLNQLHPSAVSYKESKGLQNMTGWSSADPNEDSDEEFHPIAGAFSRGGSLTSSMDSSTLSSASGLSKSASIDLTCPTSRNSYVRHGKKKKPRGSSSDIEPGGDRNHYQIRLSSFAIVLLHEDILTVSVDTGTLVPSSVNQLNATANQFFNKLALFSISPYGNKDFEDAKQVFLNACSLNHLRLLAAPVILELDERNTTMSGSVSGGSVELLECLVEDIESGCSGDSQSTAQYVELLTFTRDEDRKGARNTFTHQPDLKVKLKHVRRIGRTYSSSLDISVHLEKCLSEVDISIMDRISALLNHKPLCSRPTQLKMNDFSNMQSCFDQVLETASDCDSRLEWKISAPYLVVKLRFPIPDLRSLNDMNRPPWWKHRVHKDILFLHMTDVSVRSHTSSRQIAQSIEVQCRNAKALIQEANTDVPIPFGYTTCEPEGSAATNDFIQDVGWPRLVVRIYSTSYGLEDPLEEPVGMAQSFFEPPVREASPFTYRKVFHDNDVSHSKGKTSTNAQYEGEELVIPGDKQEISNFIDDTCRRAQIQIDIQLPSAVVQFPNKHLYELIYNRFTSDLLLWSPSAPTAQSWTQNVNINLDQVFSVVCKGSDSENESEEEEENEDHDMLDRKQNHRNLGQDQPCGQSKITISLFVAQCVLDLYTNTKDENGVPLEGEYGQIMLLCEDVHLFTVSKYKGKTSNSYVIVQINSGSVHHNNKVQNKSDIFSNCKYPPNLDHLIEVLHKSDETSIVSSTYQPVACGVDSPDMVTVAVHTYINDERQLKMNRVSCCLRGTTLRHRMSKPYQGVYSQIADFFDVQDYPIIGYEPLPIIVEFYQHFFDCAIDYRPLHLPYSMLVSLSSFNISCNLAAKTTTLTMRFIAEDISLFISNKNIQRIVDLKQDYVCVIEVGLLELSVRVSKNENQPHVDFKASNNVVHIRTCADSARALLLLLAYFGTDGDLKEQVDLNQCDTQSTGSSQSSLPILEDQEDDPQRINDLMEEAMTETVPAKSRNKNNSLSEQVEVFLFPDEGTVQEMEEEIVVDDDDYLDRDFCFLEPEAGSGCIFQTKEPEVHMYTKSPIQLLDNHFSTPVGKTDLLQPPKHFPVPVQRYTLRETTIVWHIYGGSDFGEDVSSCPSSPAFKCQSRNNSFDSTVSFNKLGAGKEITFHPRRESLESPSSLKNSPKQAYNPPVRWQERGGPARKHDVKMQLQLNKLRFQHDDYPESAEQASRQIILIHDVEIRDRLASSNINKFLYAYSSNARPRQSHAQMVVIKALHLKNNRGEQETCLKVSLLPLRLNIDQDSILFLFNFATELSGVSEEKENLPEMSSSPSDSPMYSPSSKSSKDDKHSSPIFIKSFVFSPEVLIRLDYQGKHVTMTHGPFAGILMGLAQLNCSEIRLISINHRHGLLGINKLLSFVQQSWSQDIYKNQLPSLLGGVGPMYSLVQLAQGIRDLFWLPIEQYQKDGRFVRGLQRGANSFTTSTATAALELTTRLVQAIQSVAETAFDMVSPGPSVRIHRNNSRRKDRRQKQPVDIREGLTNAMTLIRDGFGETAQTLLKTAVEEHQQKGAIGAVGGVLRQIPPTAITPFILASKATSNVLGGVKSQLVPDARKEAAHKWRTDDL